MRITRVQEDEDDDDEEEEEAEVSAEAGRAARPRPQRQHAATVGDKHKPAVADVVRNDAHVVVDADSGRDDEGGASRAGVPRQASKDSNA